jgi:hypothetical protein
MSLKSKEKSYTRFKHPAIKDSKYYAKSGIAKQFKDKFDRYVDVKESTAILKKLIAKYGNLRQLSFHVDCHISQLYRWFDGQNRMTKEWLEKLQSLL